MTTRKVRVVTPPWGTYQPRFVGACKTEWLEDGRSMLLLAPMWFMDSRGVWWKGPQGAIVDGFSIPTPLQLPFVGSPLVGKGREASAMHDIYCNYGKGENPFSRDRKVAGAHPVDIRPYEDVHRMFYEGCRAKRMVWLKARLYYRAVRIGGPKWETPDGV